MGLELFKTPLASDANLKALYRLEADGTDSGPNGKNLSNNGSPTFGAAVFGNGMIDSNGSNYLKIAENLGITGGAITIVGWIKLDSDIASSSYNFFQQDDAGTVVGNCISYEYNGGTRRLFFRRSKWNVAHQGPYYNVALGTGWNHIAYTYDGTNVRGYLNGVLVAGPTAASGNGTGSIPSDFYCTSNMPSILDDVAVFNRALTAAEILSIYQGDGWPATQNSLTNYRGRKRISSAVSI